jgi:hypothetical protein
VGKLIRSKFDQVPMKDLFMNMLLHLNQDFDDDLLMDAVEMLVGP